MAEAKLERKPGTLRDRKKAQLRAALIEVAMRLFRDYSFEKTRIEDIAIAADVAVATVYNYFSTKQQILLEIIDKNTHDAHLAVLEIVKNPPKNPVDAIIAMIKADFGNLDDEADKKLWRELLAAIMRDQEHRSHIESFRGLFRENLRQLIKVFVHRRQLKSSTNVDALVDISYAIYAYHFRQLVCIEHMTTTLALKAIRRDLNTLLIGLTVE
jgi:AcrR family transcriptional regulator